MASKEAYAMTRIIRFNGNRMRDLSAIGQTMFTGKQIGECLALTH